MSLKITPEIQSYWDRFIESDSELSHLKSYKFEAWGFGNTPEMADELGQLVLEGKKTATCSLLRAYRGHEDELPQAGAYSVLCDGSEQPLCIVLVTHVWLEKFNNISEQHAFEEGEGDRSLAYWRKAHIEFFSQYDGFHEEDDLVCEKFKVAFK